MFQLPAQEIVTEYREPMVRGTVIAPSEFLGIISNMCLVSQCGCFNNV